MYKDIILQQGQIFFGVQRIELFKAGGIQDQIRLGLRISHIGEGLKDGEAALHLLEIVQAHIVENAAIIVGTMFLLAGVNRGGKHGLKGKAVVDLLRGLTPGIAELDEHFFRKLRHGLLAGFAVGGKRRVLSGIAQQQFRVIDDHDAVAGIQKILPRAAHPDGAQLILLGRRGKVGAQLFDRADGLHLFRLCFQRGHAHSVAAVPVHQELEVIIGQARVVSLRHVAEEHILQILRRLNGQVYRGAGAGVALRDLQGQDFVLVYGKGKVVLQFGSRFLSHDAVKVDAGPGGAGGVVRLFGKGGHGQGRQHGQRQQDAE